MRAMHPHNARIRTRMHNGVSANHMVILLPYPCPRGVVRRPHDCQQCLGNINVGHVLERRSSGRLDPRAVILGRFAREGFQWQVRHQLAMQTDQEPVLGNCLANNCEIQIPFVEHGFGLGLLLRIEDHQHAFLTFRQHHFVGRHMVLANRHFLKVKRDTKVTLVAHFNSRACQPRRPHILNGNHSTCLHQLQRRFHQAFFRERITNLNRRALFFNRVVKLGRSHGRPANPVAAGFGPEVHNRHPDARSGRIENIRCIRDTGRKSIHQTIAVIRLVEPHFATNGRHTKTVAITADTFNNTVQQLFGFVMRRLAKRQRVHSRHWPRAHRKDIAQDATNTGCRTLIRFDVRGMVVAFHLEDHALPVTDIDDTRVFTRSANHLRPIGRQRPQPELG